MTPSRKQRKLPRAPSPEIIPDSDEEMNPSTTVHIDYLQSHSSTQNHASSPLDQYSSVDVLHHDPQVETQSSNTLPPHRARIANPLVKVVDYSETTSISNAIPSKMHAIERLNAISSSSESVTQAKRAKPGPGRSSAGLRKPSKNTSSLLTFDKGSLKTVKGNYPKEKASESIEGMNLMDLNEHVVAQEVESPMPEPAPSGQELLQLAGLNAEAAETLPDFGEDDENEKLQQPIPGINAISQSQLSDEKMQNSRYFSPYCILFHGLISSSLSFEKLEKEDTLLATATTHYMPDFTELRNRSTIFGRL